MAMADIMPSSTALLSSSSSSTTAAAAATSEPSSNSRRIAPAQLLFAPIHQSQPRPIPPRKGDTSSAGRGLASPVNQNGSFEFDRVLKSGQVAKRSRRTKSWRRFHLVLRHNLLSIYKNSSEEKLHKQINLSDLTAVAALKDPKGRREHMFGLFSPERNYHFQASSAADARSWVDIISREARIDEEEELVMVGSPVANRSMPRINANLEQQRRRLSTSSPEPLDGPSSPLPTGSASGTRSGVRIAGLHHTSFQENEYSGAEHASFSDLSDNPATTSASGTGAALHSAQAIARPHTMRLASQLSTAAMQGGADEDERVIWHGHLLALKSKGRVRQWKKLWVVVRLKHVALYKTEEVCRTDTTPYKDKY